MEVFRSSTCPGCGKDLKICLNCRFYRPGAHQDCLETVPDPVTEKDSANFCDYFRFRQAPAVKNPPAGAVPPDSARQNFNKLFGDAG